MNQKGMLLVLPVPFRTQGNQLFVESQAGNGLERWADNFESLVVAAPTIPEALAQQDKTMTWRNTITLANPQRFKFVPLPWAYSPFNFFSCYSSVRAYLRVLIADSRYLQFALGGLFGDWAAVAALEAYQQGRSYAIHTNRVEHEVILKSSKEAKLKTQLGARLSSPLMAIYHKQIIKNCALGLWQGQDCYAAYSPFCNNSHLIYDVHTKSSDTIKDLELIEKVKRVSNDETLRICYVGKIETIKAPLDWVKAIERAKKMGVNLQATWIGDGDLFDEMNAMITKRGLNYLIELTGFEEDRDRLLKRIRQSHIMLFTHVTSEASRSLIESLVCGTPIIGYQSKYVEEIVKDFGGGLFVPVHDWKKLADCLITLFQERRILSHLIKDAAENGKRFNDEVLFKQRSELIKTHLS
jgi:glycosyltransferase involved in cell wall biosynthesis